MSSDWTHQELVQGIWNKDCALWSSDPTIQLSIAERLGWLNSPRWLLENADSLSEWAREMTGRGFNQVILVGMGGSSLAAEVIVDVFESTNNASVTVLDSTHPDTITELLINRAWSRILFVFASKSGTTIEVQSLCSWVLDNLEEQGVAEPGSQCVAITDPGTPLAALAVQRCFLDCIESPSDVGGRFSALTVFGMAPAALSGVPINRLADNAQQMAERCQGVDVDENPGLALGQWLATQINANRDCLQLYVDESFQSLAVWLEQLIAESLGKSGKGLLPLGNATPAASSSRLARVNLGPSSDDQFWQRVDSVEDQVPSFKIVLDEPEDVAGEFFRWSFATAVAGALIGVNPFDEPDVSASKKTTRDLLDAQELKTEPTVVPVAELAATLRSAGSRSYLAVLNYLPSDPTVNDMLDEFAQSVRDRFALPVSINAGPRYLHSTGQFHKGGPDHGVFLFVYGEPLQDLDIFAEDFGFAALNQAQAMGDCAELSRIGRSVCWINLDGSRFAQLQRLRAILRECLDW